MLLSRCSKDHDNSVSSNEKFRKLSLSVFALFRPKLGRVLQYHVAVTVEGLHAGHEFLVISAVDEHGNILIHTGGNHGQRTLLCGGICIFTYHGKNEKKSKRA